MTKKEKKEFWDYLDPFIIPTLLTIFAWGLNELSAKRQNKYEDRTLQQSLVIDYVDTMSGSLATKSSELFDYGSPVWSAAQTRTVYTLRQLDELNRNSVISFLRQSNLLNTAILEAQNRIQISEGGQFAGILRAADMRGIDLGGAFMNAADLQSVLLQNADLSRANFSSANMAYSHFEDAILNNTNFVHADLTDSMGLTDDQLSTSKLCNTLLPNGLNTSNDRDCVELELDPSEDDGPTPPAT